MSGSFLLWGLLALAVFWCVGLYNRLMRMRARGLDALGSVEKHLKAYSTCIQPHLAGAGAHSGPSPVQGGNNLQLPLAWVQLQLAVESLESACKAARSTPLAMGPMETLTQSLDALETKWAALCNAPADLAGSAVPGDLMAEWDDATARVQSARGGYNQIVARYNEALSQFPARIIVGPMGFRPAGAL
jgi:LemA protein